jgi:hypothetical protein
MPDDDPDDAALSWPRAVAIGAVVLIAAFVLLIVVTNSIVTDVTGVDRHTRVALATAWFIVALAGLAFALRRLQARHVV